MFATTRNSLIPRVLRGGDDGQKALGELVTIYRPPVRKFILCHYRALAPDVEGVVEDFLFKKFVGGNLIKLYTPGPGRKFRALLSTAVRNHCVDILRADQRRYAAIGRSTYVFDEGFDQPVHDGPDDFDLAWARQVFGRAVRSVKRQCEADPCRLKRVWGILEARFLRPARGKSEVPYPTLVRCFGFSSPAIAQKAATQGKRMLAQAMLATIAEYSGIKEAQTELAELRRILQAAAGLRRTRHVPSVM